MGGLILSGDTLYGTASVGGAGGSGVVFSVNTNGANFAVLHSFTPLDVPTATNPDGALPFRRSCIVQQYALRNDFRAGGLGGRGTIFSTPDQRPGLRGVASFHSAVDSATHTSTDGASPCSAF